MQTIALEEDDSVVVGVFNSNTNTQLLQDLSGMDEWEVRDPSEIASDSPLHQAQDGIISVVNLYAFGALNGCKSRNF